MVGMVILDWLIRAMATIAVVSAIAAGSTQWWVHTIWVVLAIVWHTLWRQEVNRRRADR